MRTAPASPTSGQLDSEVIGIGKAPRSARLFSRRGILAAALPIIAPHAEARSPLAATYNSALCHSIPETVMPEPNASLTEIPSLRERLAALRGYL